MMNIESIEILFSNLRYIDLNDEIALTKDTEKGDVENYIEQLISNILKNKNTRYFDTQSEHTEVVTAINKALDNYTNSEIINDSTEIIANRLLRSEVSMQEKIKHLTELKKGSLIQSLLKSDEFYFYLIAKIEHYTFLDEDDLKKRIGLPFEKSVLKTCLLKYTEEKDIIDILIHDSNPTITRYWWDNFLELKERNSDEHNTKKAFNVIDHTLARSLKKKSPSDYTLLRNNLVGYFKSQQTFLIDDLIDIVIGSYEPNKPSEVDIEKLKEIIKNLPDKQNFDRRFNIVSKEINARIRKVYPITNKIDLNIKDHIESMKNIIKAEEDPNGNKYIKIKTDSEETFNKFKYIETR